MAGKVRKKVLISVNKEIYDKFLEILAKEGLYRGAVSETIEYLMARYVDEAGGGSVVMCDVRSAGTIKPIAQEPPTGNPHHDPEAMVINILSSTGNYKFTDREVRVAMVKAGIISNRHMSQTMKSLIRSGVLKPVIVKGNVRIYEVDTNAIAGWKSY